MKNVFSIVFAFFLIMLSGFKAYAEEIDLGELGEEYGVSELSDSLTYDASDFLEEYGISPDDPNGITELSPSDVLSYLWKKLCSSAAAPVRLLGMILSIIILGAAAGVYQEGMGGNGASGLYRSVVVMAAVIISVPTISGCIENTAATLEKGSDFMLCYVPVFAGIAAAAGNAASSLSYNGIVLLIAEGAAQISGRVLIPVLSVCLAMNIIEAVEPTLGLSSVTALLKKGLSLVLGFGMTLFTGMLSIQSIVGASADTLGVKAAKFVVSNFVPVVGSAVADAYTTMRSGLGLLRGAAGAFGIIALCVTILPPILEMTCLYLTMTAGEAAAEMFGIKPLGAFFKGTASVLSIGLAVAVCFGVMFVIATVILMAAGLGSGNA